MRSPLVSVLMAVKNPHPVYFTEAVNSILRQTLTDFEFLIMEAPSQRSAKKLLKGIEDPRIRYVQDARWTHVNDQRNHGLSIAQASLVAIIDADDVAEPCRLERQVAYLLRNPGIDVLGSQISVIDGAGRHLGYRSFPLTHAMIVAAMRKLNPISNPSVVFDRAKVIAAGAYQYTKYPAEDYELWCRLAKERLRFATHPQALLRYRLHGEQVKAHALRATIQGAIDVKSTYWGTEMTLDEKLRLWAERSLLLFPMKLVYAALQRFWYSDSLCVEN